LAAAEVAAASELTELPRLSRASSLPAIRATIPAAESVRRIRSSGVRPQTRGAGASAGHRIQARGAGFDFEFDNSLASGGRTAA